MSVVTCCRSVGMALLVMLLPVTAPVVRAAEAAAVERGPYTMTPIADGVWNLQDYNHTNPRGIHLDANGKRSGMNNTSDMYLVVGRDKALLIDLSNAVTWDASATESLRQLVKDKIGTRLLVITATHEHGDHLGMLPAFRDDPQASFWVAAGEFGQKTVFPAGKTVYFAPGASLDLGGRDVTTRELPGHTLHSTLFMLKAQNLLFTGDAVGSGIGVWLFDYDSLLRYRQGISDLLAWLETPASGLDRTALRLHSAHTWQFAPRSALGSQYLYDMRTLIDKMEKGEVQAVAYNVGNPFLDATFTWGEATITWNKAAAERFRRVP